MKKEFFILFSFFLCSLGHATFQEEVISPITTKAKYPFLISSALTLGTAIFEDSIVDPTQKETIEDRPLGSFSHYGDLLGQLLPNGLYTLGMGLNGYLRDKSSYQNSLVMIKATAYAASVATILKFAVGEKRPNGADKRSFPSGHTTTAFAFASTVATLHHWVWGIGAYSIAGLVAFSRVNDNAHWLHDVLAGASIGLGYGIGISDLYMKKSSNTTFYILPTKEGIPYLRMAIAF